jgi:hypothetical protein
VPYKELGSAYLNDKIETKRKKYLKNELEKMGYKVNLSTPAATETSS